jgi:predicted phage terminase large subunit-like protein
LYDPKVVALGAYFWQALYQQNPQAEGGTEWPEAYFHPGIWFDTWPDTWRCKCLALDPSKGSESKHGDYAAFVMIMISAGHIWVDAHLVRGDTAVLVQTAVELCRSFRPDWFAVETNQFQHLLAEQIVQAGRQTGVPLPVYSVENRLKKEVRIRRLTPCLAPDSLRFKRDSPGARLLVNQLRDFPCGQYDDGPDALDMAINVASEQVAYGQPQEWILGSIIDNPRLLSQL